MDYEFDWRYRVGLIIPSVNTVTEPLFYTIAPKGITFHSTRTPIKGTSVEEVIAMGTEKDRAIRELASARVDCIADCCTMSGVLRGLAADTAFRKQIEEDTGIRAVSTVSAVFEALNTFKLHRIVLVSPNPEETDKAAAAFWEQNGFNVVSIRGMGFTDGYEMGLVDPQQIHSFCKSAWDTRAEGLFITCMNFNAVPITEALEADLQVPVVSSNAATLWKILRTIGVKESIRGCGRLLSDYVSSQSGE